MEMLPLKTLMKSLPSRFFAFSLYRTASQCQKRMYESKLIESYKRVLQKPTGEIVSNTGLAT